MRRPSLCPQLHGGAARCRPARAAQAKRAVISRSTADSIRGRVAKKQKRYGASRSWASSRHFDVSTCDISAGHTARVSATGGDNFSSALPTSRSRRCSARGVPSHENTISIRPPNRKSRACSRRPSREEDALDDDTAVVEVTVSHRLSPSAICVSSSSRGEVSTRSKGALGADRRDRAGRSLRSAENRSEGDRDVIPRLRYDAHPAVQNSVGRSLRRRPSKRINPTRLRSRGPLASEIGACQRATPSTSSR